MFRAAQAITQMTELRDSDAVRFIHGDFLKVIHLTPPLHSLENKTFKVNVHSFSIYTYENELTADFCFETLSCRYHNL